ATFAVHLRELFDLFGDRGEVFAAFLFDEDPAPEVVKIGVGECFQVHSVSVHAGSPGRLDGQEVVMSTSTCAPIWVPFSTLYRLKYPPGLGEMWSVPVGWVVGVWG